MYGQTITILEAEAVTPEAIVVAETEAAVRLGQIDEDPEARRIQAVKAEQDAYARWFNDFVLSDID